MAALRIAVITPIPTPYRDPFWSVVARQPDVDLTVFYCSAGKSDRPWAGNWKREYRYEVLPGRNLLSWRGADASCFWNPDILRRMSATRFDAVVVAGYNHLTMCAAMWLANRQGVPFYVTCESHLRRARAPWKQQLKRWGMRWLVRRSSGFFPTGILASEYLAHYGVDARRMARLPNVPDVTRQQEIVQSLRAQPEAALCSAVRGRRVVLFVGRLIPKKRAGLLIQAFLETCREHEAALVIAGDGPERGALEAQVAQQGMAERVLFTGFIQPEELIHWYARADLFVLPSSETWGAAAVEALAAGVPVILSDETGCHVDVVRNPTVGTVVPAGDAARLAEALRQQLSAAVSHDVVDAAWNDVRQDFTYERQAQSFLQLIRATCVPAPKLA